MLVQDKAMAPKTDKNLDLILIDPAFSHGGGVRLGTLVLIRWLAVAGQLVALAIVDQVLHFDARLDLTLPTVIASALLNLWFSLRADTNTRLTEKQSAAHLTFDLAHLTLLLFFTGGLANPFAVLTLAPATVSATILSRRSTKILLAISLSFVTALAFTPFPLPWDGPLPETHGLMRLSIWISLCFTLVFLTLYMARIGREGRERARALAATQAALVQEQRLAALGTLAAAAAHELGTPLGTILLASQELLETWNGDENTRADLALIVEQTTRCRDILAELRQNRTTGDSDHFSYMAVEAILREAAGPHEQRGIKIHYASDGAAAENIRRTPELIHAFRNIIENAVGFALDAVHIQIQWSDEKLTVSVEDDGPGFDPQILKRLGEPYVTTRQPTPGTDGGLGLGLFIAKTLLESTGASLDFEKATPHGARITLAWQRAILNTESLAIMQREA
jgi:two-component system, sensor histidine kinase RegB